MARVDLDNRHGGGAVSPLADRGRPWQQKPARSPVETSFAWPCQQRQRLSEMAGPNEISSALDRPSSFAVTSSTSIAYESHPLAPCRSRRRLNLPFQLVRSIPVYTCEMADPAIS